MTIEEGDRLDNKQDTFCDEKVNKYGEVAREGDSWEYCGLILFKIWSKPANISLGEPSIVYKNPETGETQIAVNKNEPPPRGFEKIELRNPIERSKFEKEENEKYSARNRQLVAEREFNSEQMKKNRRDDVKAKLSDIAAHSENPNVTENLMRASMNRKNKKRKVETETNFRFAVNHSDSTNLKKE